MQLYEDDAFKQCVSRHFVALTGRYATFDTSGKQVSDYADFAYSAFVIEILGRWCLITAGHVIERINDLVIHPTVKLVRCGFADYFSSHAVIKETTYFDYPSTHKIHVNRDDLDIGIVPLSDFYMASLKANGVLPMPVSAWVGHSPPHCDSYVLLGLPEEKIDTAFRIGDRGTRVGISVLLVLIPLEAHAHPPPDKIVSGIPRFTATLMDGEQLGSPVGMSGGPIIGLLRSLDGPSSYACIAVQGSWDRHTRMVFGTPMAIVADTIERLIETPK